MNRGPSVPLTISLRCEWEEDGKSFMWDESNMLLSDVLGGPVYSGVWFPYFQPVFRRNDQLFTSGKFDGNTIFVELTKQPCDQEWQPMDEPISLVTKHLTERERYSTSMWLPSFSLASMGYWLIRVNAFTVHHHTNQRTILGRFQIRAHVSQQIPRSLHSRASDFPIRLGCGLSIEMIGIDLVKCALATTNWLSTISLEHVTITALASPSLPGFDPSWVSIRVTKVQLLPERLQIGFVVTPRQGPLAPGLVQYIINQPFKLSFMLMEIKIDLWKVLDTEKICPPFYLGIDHQPITTRARAILHTGLPTQLVCTKNSFATIQFGVPLAPFVIQLTDMFSLPCIHQRVHLAAELSLRCRVDGTTHECDIPLCARVPLAAEDCTFDFSHVRMILESPLILAVAQTFARRNVYTMDQVVNHFQTKKIRFQLYVKTLPGQSGQPGQPGIPPLVYVSPLLALM